MRKIQLLSFALMMLLGCNTKSNTDSPKDVLISFLDAIFKKDINTAKKLATTDSKTMLDLMKGQTDAEIQLYDKSKIEFEEVKINGDKATILAKFKNSKMTNSLNNNYILRKENNA